MRKCVVVIDAQNDFVSGSLGFEEASHVIDNISHELKIRRDEPFIIFTRDTHYSDYLDTLEGKHLPVMHCQKETWGWEIDSRLDPFISESTPIFNKQTFASNELGMYLQHHSFDSIELMGLVSNICIISNAVLIRTVCPNIPIIVNRKFTSSFDVDLNNKALDVMIGLQIEVI